MVSLPNGQNRRHSPGVPPRRPNLACGLVAAPVLCRRVLGVFGAALQRGVFSAGSGGTAGGMAVRGLGVALLLASACLAGELTGPGREGAGPRLWGRGGGCSLVSLGPRARHSDRCGYHRASVVSGEGSSV